MTKKKKRKRDPNQPLLLGRDAYIARLKNGETVSFRVSFREGGNSMTLRIKSREKCTYEPVTSVDQLKVGDAVFCKVGPNFFTHLITAIRDEQVQISNNHGHVNGWTHISNVFGRVIAIEK